MNDKPNKIILLPSFVNTKLFSEEAQNFQRDGYYTSSPPGTYGHREYWDEQTKRCLEGYSIGGIRITGLHYFYLNFYRMKATIKVGKIERKTLTFPRFLDMDYYAFHEIEQGRFDEEGMVIAKSRRKGWSYKMGALCDYQYNFYRDSTTIIGAYLDEYAQNTMDMVLEGINFVNTNTDWAKRKNPDRRDYIKARFKEAVDGREIWGGYNSEIFTLTFKDNSSAAIGKTADIMIFEEAGKWPNLINSYMLTAPVFRDGNKMIGQPFVFGTGGDMGKGTMDFAEMFYNPRKYWMRSYENIYDENAVGECGFFVDDMWYKPGKVFISYKEIPQEVKDRYSIPVPNKDSMNDKVAVEMVDADGNSNRFAAEYFLDIERDARRGKGSGRDWEDYITQYPKTPREAFLKPSGNIFPTIELNELLGQLETNNRASKLGMVGDLFWTEEGKVKWRPNQNLNPIMDFPLRNDKDHTGCVIIYESPYRDINGNVPHNMYIAGTDPYDHDSSSTDSLGSTFIYKTFQGFDKSFDVLVAEYTGRPDTAFEWYETTRKLLAYYNAKSLYENNLKGFKVYMEQKKSLHLLKEQPAILKDIVKESNTQRGYGVHMSKEIKMQCEIYTRDWLLEKKTDKEGIGERLNLHDIPSIPLVKELIAYDREGNFDRVIAFFLIMLHKQENYKKQVQQTYQETHRDNFFQKKLFQNNKGTRLNSFR